MSYSVFAATSVARTRGPGSNEARLINTFEELANTPAELLPIMQRIVRDSSIARMDAAAKTLRVLGVPLTYSLADVEPLYKAHQRLYGSPDGSRSVDQALQVYAILLGEMEYYQERMRRLSKAASAYLALINGRSDDLQQIAEAYASRLTSFPGRSTTEKHAFFPPGALGDMLYGMIYVAPPSDRKAHETIDMTVSATIAPDFESDPAFKAAYSKRLANWNVAKEAVEKYIKRVALYNPAEVRQLGFEPVLTDSVGTPLTDVDDVLNELQGKGKTKGLAIRFTGEAADLP